MASVDLGKARAFLVEVEAIRRRIAGTNMTFVQGLLSRAREIDSAEREVRRREAPRFNIFETLNVLDTELVHSNFLAFLLDPRSTLDQGIFFLQSFLERFLKKFHLPVPTVEDSFVQSEFVTPNGRLDVVLLLHTRAAICIENKVREVEQEDQIRRYQNYLESLRQPTHRLVIFLSPMGTEPMTGNSESSIPVVQVSYVQIAEWLRTVSLTLPRNLGSTLSMYADSCERLVRRSAKELK